MTTKWPSHSELLRASASNNAFTIMQRLAMHINDYEYIL